VDALNIGPLIVALYNPWDLCSAPSARMLRWRFSEEKLGNYFHLHFLLYIFSFLPC